MALAGSWVSQALRSVVSDLNTTVISVNEADGLAWRVHTVYRELLAMEALGELDHGEGRAVLELVERAHSHMRQVAEIAQPPSCSQAPILLVGEAGRPRFDIPYHQLEHLVQAHFSGPQIATMLGVSVSTIRRRMSQYNLTIGSTYSSMSDAYLDQMVSEAQREFPGWGNRQMYGYFISRGIRVQFQRIRESQSRVDPEGSALRRLHHLRRRHYCVGGPQHLWHVDGNHKLIRLRV